MKEYKDDLSDVSGDTTSQNRSDNGKRQKLRFIKKHDTNLAKKPGSESTFLKSKAIRSPM